MSSLGGLDGLVFTAGIGENAPQIRAAVAARFVWTGLTLDPQANGRSVGLSAPPAAGSRRASSETNEEAIIARQIAHVIL